MKHSKYIILLIMTGLIIFGTTGIWAAEKRIPQLKFEEANEKFESGDMEGALDIYKSLVNDGWGGASLYYNLGNLFYRMGDRGRAILWYERARRLSPRDSDILFNLNLSREHIKATGNQWIDRVVLFFTGSELAFILTILLWAFFVLLALRLLDWVHGEVWPEASLWSLGFILLFFSVWLGAHIYVINQPESIVTKTPGEVRNGPGTDYAVGFTVPEGTKVVILNRRPDWVQVGVPHEGLKGWMPAKDVEPITLAMSS